MGRLRGQSFAFFPIAVQGGDGINARVLRADDVPGNVAHHHGLFAFRQHAADQVGFVDVQLLRGRPGHSVKVFEQIKVPKNINGGMLGFAGRNSQINAPLLQSAEQSPDAGIDLVFLPADGNIPLPVQVGGVSGLLLGHAAVFHIAVRQRWTEEPPQGRFRRHGQAHFL